MSQTSHYEKYNKKNYVFVVASTIILLMLCELFSYVYLAFSSGPISSDDFRMGKPEAYKKSPYFSKRFIAESIASGSIFYTPNESRIILAHDFNGNFINVESGDRLTFPKIEGQNKLYLFGGSTVYSGEVPDYYTIPSLLSRFMSDNGLSSHEVINKGVTSVNVTQQVEYLKTVQIKSGDLVIFYSGVNDILQGLYFGNPEGTIISQQSHNKSVALNNKVDKVLLRVNTYRLLKRLANSFYQPKHLKSKVELTSLANNVEAVYKSNILRAKEITEKSGGIFLNVVQPNLYSKSYKSKNEKWIDENVAFRGLQAAFEIGNEALKRASIDLSRKGVNSTNFETIFNDLEEECFLDGYHVTEICNGIAASQLYELIFKKKNRSSVRSYLNLIHYQYVDEMEKDYLYTRKKSTHAKLVKSIKEFVPDNFFGEFDKKKLRQNKLDGFF